MKKISKLFIFIGFLAVFTLPTLCKANDVYGDSWHIYNWYYDATDSNRLILKWVNVATSTDWAKTLSASTDARYYVDASHFYRFREVVGTDCWISATTTPCYEKFKYLDYYNGSGFSTLKTNTSGLTQTDMSAYLTTSWWIKNQYISVKYTGGSTIDTAHETQNVFHWGDADTSPPTLPTISITSPASGSSKSSAFNFEITFNTLGVNYNRIMIILEDWDASSTCPADRSAQWYQEYPLYFNYQSLPIFSPIFTATTTASTTISVDNLPARIYKCVRCVFINDILGTISSELCPTYNITITQTIQPTGTPVYYFSIPNWTTYYASNTKSFATSTELFNTITDAILPVVQWIGNFNVFFNQYFSTASSTSMGNLYGTAIPTFRGYLVIIDNYFNGLPVSLALMFFLITAIVIICIKLLKTILLR